MKLKGVGSILFLLFLLLLYIPAESDSQPQPFSSRHMDYFLDTVSESLLQEMAQGRGENLTAFTFLLECNEVGAALLASSVQKNYAFVFPTAEIQPREVLPLIRTLGKFDSTFFSTISKNCPGL